MSSRVHAAIAAIARADGRGVEPLETIADRVGGADHHDLRELPDVVVEDAVGPEIHGRDGQGRREANLELAEGGAADRAAEPGDARLTDARAIRQIADRHARGRLVVDGDRLGYAALGGRQVALDPLDARNKVDPSDEFMLVVVRDRPPSPRVCGSDGLLIPSLPTSPNFQRQSAAKSSPVIELHNLSLQGKNLLLRQPHAAHRSRGIKHAPRTPNRAAFLGERCAYAAIERREEVFACAP